MRSAACGRPNSKQPAHCIRGKGEHTVRLFYLKRRASASYVQPWPAKQTLGSRSRACFAGDQAGRGKCWTVGLRLAGGSALLCCMSDIGVLVWDERQPRQQEAYDNFLGNAIAGHLRAQDGLAVQSAGLDDPARVCPTPRSMPVRYWSGGATCGTATCRRKPAGGSSTGSSRVGCPSSCCTPAHWATPFVEAMDYRTREDARRRFPDTGGERVAGVRAPREPLPGSRQRRRGHPRVPGAQVPRPSHPRQRPTPDLLLPGLARRRPAELFAHPAARSPDRGRHPRGVLTAAIGDVRRAAACPRSGTR